MQRLQSAFACGCSSPERPPIALFLRLRLRLRLRLVLLLFAQTLPLQLLPHFLGPLRPLLTGRDYPPVQLCRRRRDVTGPASSRIHEPFAVCVEFKLARVLTFYIDVARTDLE